MGSNSERGETPAKKNYLREVREEIGDSETPADAPAKITKGGMPVEADLHHGRPRQPDQTYSGQKFQERAVRGASQGTPEQWQAVQQGQHDPKASMAPRK